MDITQLISNLGFPIACVIGLGYYVYQAQKTQAEENAKREERLYQIIDKQSEQLSEVKTSLDTLNKTLTERGM